MLFEQSFAFSDVPRIFVLVFLELLLSADNAVVLALLSRTLPPDQRKKVLFIGVASAFVLRAVAIAVIATLFENTWIQLAGAVYLIYLCFRYFTSKKKKEFHGSGSFWKTVVLIEFLDLTFALDSIVAGIAFIEDSIPKLWIVYVGGMIGLLGMRYAAGLFAKLIDWFPKLESSAYMMVGWIGIKLGFGAMGHPIPTFLFWAVTALLFLLGFIRSRR